MVENDKGESLSLDVLSRGTREAVFIGLRLALVGSFARRGAMLPLVLDDVLVNFDTRPRAAVRPRCCATLPARPPGDHVHLPRAHHRHF